MTFDRALRAATNSSVSAVLVTRRQSNELKNASGWQHYLKYFISASGKRDHETWPTYGACDSVERTKRSGQRGISIKCRQAPSFTEKASRMCYIFVGVQHFPSSTPPSSHLRHWTVLRSKFSSEHSVVSLPDRFGIYLGAPFPTAIGAC